MIPLNWVRWSPKRQNADFWAKNPVFVDKIQVFWKSTKSFVTIMEGHQKDNILVLTLLYGEL